MISKRGVYFLANDQCVELTIAFLNSFRFWNPSISLCFVPFDDRVASVEASLAGALELSRHMELMCAEPPFLNFLLISAEIMQ